jgi:hypothetical protein
MGNINTNHAVRLTDTARLHHSARPHPNHDSKATETSDTFLPSPAREDSTHLYRPQGMKGGRPVLSDNGPRTPVYHDYRDTLIEASKNMAHNIGESRQQQPLTTLNDLPELHVGPTWTGNPPRVNLTEAAKYLDKTMQEWRQKHPNQVMTIPDIQKPFW